MQERINKRIVYFVRHGERSDLLTIEKNGEGKPQKNAYLSDYGKAQAFVTGMSIAKNVRPLLKPDSKILILTSPYIRTVQTGFQIMLGMKTEGIQVYDTTLFYTDYLKEYQNHKTTMTKAELQAEFKMLNLPESILLQEGGDQLSEHVDSESPMTSYARTREFVDKLKNPELDIAGMNPDVIICVSHAFFFINLFFMFQKPMEAYGLIDYCSYSRLRIQEDKKSVLDIVNKHYHLDKLSLTQRL